MTTSQSADVKATLSSDELSKQIEVLRADLMKLAEIVSGDVSDGIGKATDKIGRAGRDAQSSATNAVLGHPLSAVAIAAGFGLLLGLVARKG
jgi:ElaB/YqjD/DUF883 family membrane-anchored ribosome-binding protein